MIESRSTVLKRIEQALSKDRRWNQIFATVDALVRVHVGVFVEPYITLIADGKKTIETRFSKKRIAPHFTIDPGDIVLVKRAGGSIVGIFRVNDAWTYNLKPGALQEIRRLFGPAICPVGAAFWNDRKEAAFCSLIWVSDFRTLPTIPFAKSDRRGWVILK